MKLISDIDYIVYPANVASILPHFIVAAGEIEISAFGRKYAHLLTAVILVTSTLACVDVLSESRSFKIITKSGDTEEINQTIETIFCIISYTIIILTGTQNAEKHFRTLNEIAKIDEFLEATGYEGSYKCPKLVASVYTMSISVIGVAYYYLNRSDMVIQSQIILLSVYILQLFISSTFAIYFCVILKNVTRRIEFVNEKLTQFTREGTRSNEENWRELSNLIEIFCKFRYITENLNSVTGVGLLFYMGYAFYTVTNQSYLVFSTLTNHVAFAEKFQQLGLSVSWVIAEIVLMSVFCNSCDAISSEANTTSQILARVYGKSKDYQNIIDKFLTKSIRQEVQFTAYGFFVVDNSTLFKIFSAVTTYLVILIQFKQLEDTKLDESLDTNKI